jgi:hypothetical protein
MRCLRLPISQEAPVPQVFSYFMKSAIAAQSMSPQLDGSAERLLRGL